MLIKTLNYLETPSLRFRVKTYQLTKVKNIFYCGKYIEKASYVLVKVIF